MSFRKYGGVQYANKHNIVSSNYNTSNNLLVTEKVGQPNTYINFQSDISGNINVYGDFDLSGNLTVRGNTDISGNLFVGGNTDISGNLDVSGNIIAYEIFLSSYPPNISTQPNAVVPKAYVDLVSTGIKPLGQVTAISTFDNSGNTPIFPVPINTNVAAGFVIDGVVIESNDSVLLNDQGIPSTSSAINNGVYVYTNVGGGNYQFIRSATILPNGYSDAKGVFIAVDFGTRYAKSGWVQIEYSISAPTVVGTDPLYFNVFYNFNYQSGQGLNVSQVGNTYFINVDSSLNFLTGIDASNNGTLDVGTQSSVVNIGTSNGVTNINSTFNVNKGITGGTGSFTYLTTSNDTFIGKTTYSGMTGTTLYVGSDNTNNINGAFGGKIIFGGTPGDAGNDASRAQITKRQYSSSSDRSELFVFNGNDNSNDRIRLRSGKIAFDIYPVGEPNDSQIYNENIICSIDKNGFTGPTGSFTNLSASQQILAPGGITGATGSFTYFTVSQAFNIPVSISGGTGSFTYLSASQNIFAPGGITGATGSFTYLSASQGITGSTGSFSYLSASQGITGATGSFSYLSASQGITGSTGSFSYLSASQGITGSTGSFTYLTTSNDTFIGKTTYSGMTGTTLYVGSDNTNNINGAFGGKIIFGGTSGDTGNDVSRAQITKRKFNSNNDNSELFIFNGNDNPTDRIRLRSGQILFDTYPTGYIVDSEIYNENIICSITNNGFTGPTGSFTYLSASQGITGATGSFTNLSASQQILARAGITGATGSFTNLSASQQILAPAGITGATGSFTNLSASQQILARAGITGATGSFTNLVSTNNSYLAITSGSVGIGTISPSFTLDVSGNVRATSYTSTSDYRVKEQIIKLDDSFNVDNLMPIKYKLKNTNKETTGFIAHELQEVYPFLVEGEKDGKELQSIDYNGLISILVKEIQELKKRINILENKIK